MAHSLEAGYDTPHGVENALLFVVGPYHLKIRKTIILEKMPRDLQIGVEVSRELFFWRLNDGYYAIYLAP